MIRVNLWSFIWLIFLLPLAGCSMCSSTFDQHYAAHGGSWERDNPTHGRVGSAFTDAGGPASRTAKTNEQSDGVKTNEPYYEASPTLGPALRR